MSPLELGPPIPAARFAVPVVQAARQLVGCVVSHGPAVGRIVETEAYHEREPACHAHVGLTPRTRTLFGAPGRAYVYRSYGIHALLNVVSEPRGIGAAVLIRALEPLAGIEEMRLRRGPVGFQDLCSGPGKLTQALGIGLELDDTELERGPIRLHPRPGGDVPRMAVAPRVGITKAADLPWRFCLAASPFVSRPRPASG